MNVCEAVSLGVLCVLDFTFNINNIKSIQIVLQLCEKEGVPIGHVTHTLWLFFIKNLVLPRSRLNIQCCGIEGLLLISLFLVVEKKRLGNSDFFFGLCSLLFTYSKFLFKHKYSCFKNTY